MKKCFLILSLLVWSVAAIAQESKIPQRLELVTVDLELGDEDSLLSTEENLEKVTVTYERVLLTNLLAFSVERQGYIRATHIPKNQFNSLVKSLKFYRKLHPNEL